MMVADARALRKQEDLAKLRGLQQRTNSRVEVVSVEGNPPRKITCHIHIPTAVDRNYPHNKNEVSEVVIELPADYPFLPPTVTFNTPIWNPNVYASGRWCFGDWKVTENLELFVIRLMKVVALDPTIVNPSSPANPGAASWYVKMLHTKPGLFPTVVVNSLLAEPEKPKLVWKTLK